MTTRAATAAGGLAILLWSTLAIFTAMSGGVPPFLLVALTFAIGGLFILAVAAARGRLHLARPTWSSLALGIYGPFGDTALYFAALKSAPPAEANLIHYLWPLLIVLFAALLPGGGLKARHLLGALIGLAATALIIIGRGGVGGGAGGGALLGYGLAAAGAVVWATYSVISRRFSGVPSESVGVTTLLCAVLALLCHFAFEDTRMPANAMEWAGVAGLGLGSMGLAFLAWDIGMKKGDVALLGALAYAAPVLSTLILIGFGFTKGGAVILISCALIVLGACVASWPELRGVLRRRRHP
jgi:drug/metabolite transporter (DMT)-like permease